MGKVRIANKFAKNAQIRLMVRAGNNSELALIRRGIKVANAAKRRLGSNPRRIDTGLLRASITVQVIEDAKGGVRIGTNVEYALFVHDGTRNMAPNPFLTDALRSVIHN